ncbi:MAG: hypothetical protein BWY99_01462 [Synergistetes bacterium ADurb.BinA166]|nr:MAG: hypothetical protein BWY99_01462 [Synergistetes bacterium ADurb.BinA166]
MPADPADIAEPAPADAAPAPAPEPESLRLTRPEGFKAVRVKELRERAKAANPAVIAFVKGIERGGETPGSAAYSYAAALAAKNIDMPLPDMAWVILQVRREVKKVGKGELAAALVVLEEIYAALVDKASE